MEKINEYIDKNKDYYIEKLSQAVGIASVSCDAQHRGQVLAMAEWLQTEMTRLNVTHETRDPGTQELEGETIKLPPILLGRYGNDSAKKTGTQAPNKNTGK